MTRWEPGARERLQAAALELYASQGFDETSAAEIAAAVGLTERTFFRHFADKREVIFARGDLFQAAFTDRIADGPVDAAALDLVKSAVLGAAEFFPAERLAYSRQRGGVIAATPELQERELLKMAALASAMAGALRARGIPEPAATLAAETGVTVFRISFERWIAEGGSLADIEREVFQRFFELER